MDIPAEIAAMLNRGDFAELTDDEYARLGAWLTANARKVYHGLDPANLEQTERMEAAKRRLRTIYGYNATSRQCTQRAARQGQAARQKARPKRWTKDMPRPFIVMNIQRLLKDNPSMTDRELAAKMGVSLRTIQRWSADPVIGKAWSAVSNELRRGFVDAGDDGQLNVEGVEPSSPHQGKMRRR